MERVQLDTISSAVAAHAGSSAATKPGQRTPRLLAALPRGEAIRNFVYSHALDIVAQDVDVTVATVVPNAEVAALLEERYGELLRLELHRERWPAGATCEALELAHGRYLWSEAAKERWRLRDLEGQRRRGPGQSAG